MFYVFIVFMCTKTKDCQCWLHLLGAMTQPTTGDVRGRAGRPAAEVCAVPVTEYLFFGALLVRLRLGAHPAVPVRRPDQRLQPRRCVCVQDVMVIPAVSRQFGLNFPPTCASGLAVVNAGGCHPIVFMLKTLVKLADCVEIADAFLRGYEQCYLLST